MSASESGLNEAEKPRPGRFLKHCKRCAHPCSGDMRACAAGGHPSRTPPAPPTTTCMPERRPIMQLRRSNPQPDSPTSIMQARQSCIFEVCISAFAARIMRLFAAATMPSRAHLSTSPPRLSSKRADKAQGQRWSGIGLHGERRGFCAIAIVRAGAQARTFSVPPPSWRGGEPLP